MILGAGVAVLLRVFFTLVVAQAMTYPFLKLVGGLLLFWVAIKLVTEDAEEGDGHKSGETLWRAVRIVAIADIVMSLDNVIAIAASADIAAARVDLIHAEAMKAYLIIFGLATSVPLIVAGSALLMALLQRFRVLVWAGGALLGWVAGDIMATDPAVPGWLVPAVLDQVHTWAGPFGAALVIIAGYVMVSRHRSLHLDEILAGIGLIVWVAADMAAARYFGGHADALATWGVRGAVLLVLIVAYAIVRSVSGTKTA
jgi:YjbE family integral membrane protein